MYTVIMAGGKGTRIASMHPNIPKPMVPICGKPILEHQIEVLRKQGCTNIILIIGHMGDIIREYFGSGEAYGVTIQYIEEKEPLGTAGALYYLKDQIKEDFLLLNGDIIFDVDLKRMISFHQKASCTATILTHPNSHPYDSAIVLHENSGKVTGWLAKEETRLYYRNCVNAGIHLFSPSIFDFFTEPKKMDLDRDLLRHLIAKGLLYAYTSSEYVKDMGTPQRYTEVEADLISGKVQKQSLHEKQKAFFLDRDGTVNIAKGFIKRAEDIELCPGAAEAIKKINANGYLAIIVSNQPVIARGEATFAEVDRMMDKIETLLGESGAYLNDRFYCPHHPDQGFKGEIAALKIRCTCRKPAPGLLLMAAEKYNIDLTQSYMVGDSQNDIDAGKNAGCQAFLLNNFNGNSYDYENLLACVNDVLSQDTQKKGRK